MRIVESADGLAGARGGVFVPTMGGLHEGHAALIRKAAALDAGPVVVSVFVNPTQFDERSDYERYPRALDVDADLAERCGASIVYAPPLDEVYPPGVDVPVPPLPAVATEPGLEDRFRPGHFEGVCQVVRRLFDLVGPRVAVFGEKDWQQLQAVRAMSERDRLGVEVVPCATAREPDGLALSSRNRFLSPERRRDASGVPLALCHACAHGTPDEAEARMRRTLASHRLRVEYAAVRDAETLLAYRGGRPGRALVAARAGDVRLIDNASWPDPGGDR